MNIRGFGVLLTAVGAFLLTFPDDTNITALSAIYVAVCLQYLYILFKWEG